MNIRENKELHKFINKTRGQRYKRYRQDILNISQDELAHILDIDANTIASYECGRTEPSIDMLIQLANVFRISIDELVDRQVLNADNDEIAVKNALTNASYKAYVVDMKKQFEALTIMNKYIKDMTKNVDVIAKRRKKSREAKKELEKYPKLPF